MLWWTNDVEYYTIIHILPHICLFSSKCQQMDNVQSRKISAQTHKKHKKEIEFSEKEDDDDEKVKRK